MAGTSKKLSLIVLITILIPLGVYLTFEITTMNQNEEIIQSVYETQIESVLFSVNQYSNDYLSSRLSQAQKSLTGEDPAYLLDSFQARKFFQYFAIHMNDSSYFHEETPANIQTKILEVIESQRNVMEQLEAYLEVGYQKIEPVGLIEEKGILYQCLMMTLKSGGKSITFLGLLEPLPFVEEVLSPKMQEIAKEEMVLSLQYKENPEIIYQTDTLRNEIFVTSEMWLFPDLLVGASPKIFTMQQLVDDRLHANLVALGLLSTLLILGLTLIIRNVNREIRLAKTKSDFVSNISHELRTPLALISMFAETLMLKRVDSEEKKEEYYGIMYKETNRLTNIVNRILNFSQIEAGTRKYQFSFHDANSLVEELLRDYSYHLEQKGFEFEFVPASKSALISCDREAIYEAIVNLLDNAIKYSNDQNKIVLAVESVNNKVSISITDFGIGIPEDRLEQIFEKFYRVGSSDIHNTKGAGLGLSIIQHIIHAHDAEIGVESKKGKGSTFTLTFNESHGEDPSS